MLETLALLEGACTQLAAYRISNAQIRELERLQKRGAKALQEKAWLITPRTTPNCTP